MVAIGVQAQIELAAEDGRDRPLLGQPREGVWHEREDVELHQPANPSATSMRPRATSTTRMQYSTIGRSTPESRSSTSFAPPGVTASTVPSERPVSSTTCKPTSSNA